MERKLLVAILVPPAVIVAYSLIYHIDFVNVIRTMSPVLFSAFLASYFGQLLILSIRDSRIAKVSYFTAFKARFLGNAVGLIIPGWVGQDLVRATVYAKKNRDLVSSFAYSLNEAFYDVVIGSAMFLALIEVKASPVDLIYILVTLGNIVGWTLGTGYVIFTSKKVVKAEERMVNFLKMQSYYVLLQRGKERVREATTPGSFILNSLITIVGYLVQSVAFFFVVPKFPIDVLVNMTYFAASLIPIPASSGFAELGLSIYFTPSVVVALRILELIDYSLGFLLIKEIGLGELKKQIEEIRSYGKLPERPGT
ncbi:flippase-like domain-containing protein [Metallosphaera tengchongensis]|uniref:Flippase-like domain-containing protein n=1 Tax=Metallosphaera tengchongensis TaxID=1532350 RepID=A0A6N0NTF8_9CREN|nr:lysylphosphatidylglycerol synthase domain-containing protein [Metallosphaera tengchongensis]QKQ99474.1 flippase-like domain-containing protein [Metallosphaera tengchongensis]